nr:MAG TPA: hypothetical protein [Caudoviricetes sp.]
MFKTILTNQNVCAIIWLIGTVVLKIGRNSQKENVENRLHFHSSCGILCASNPKPSSQRRCKNGHL